MNSQKNVFVLYITLVASTTLGFIELVIYLATYKLITSPLAKLFLTVEEIELMVFVHQLFAFSFISTLGKVFGVLVPLVGTFIFLIITVAIANSLYEMGRRKDIDEKLTNPLKGEFRGQ